MRTVVTMSPLPEGVVSKAVVLLQPVWARVTLPPLIVTHEELDLGIAALDRHLAIADALVEA